MQIYQRQKRDEAEARDISTDICRWELRGVPIYPHRPCESAGRAALASTDVQQQSDPIPSHASSKIMMENLHWQRCVSCFLLVGAVWGFLEQVSTEDTQRHLSEVLSSMWSSSPLGSQLTDIILLSPRCFQRWIFTFLQPDCMPATAQHPVD